MTDERKHIETPHKTDTDAKRPPQAEKRKLSDQKPILGSEGEGSPGLDIAGGGSHA